MYRLQIFTEKLNDFGLGSSPKEYIVSSTDEVCKIISALSGSKVFINLKEIKIASVDDVKRDFKLLP